VAELQYSNKVNLKPIIQDALDNLTMDLKKNFPQVKKTAKILGVSFSFFCYKLTPKPTINYSLRQRMENY